MPVDKCPNGKWRIGKGKCMYDSEETAERAYKGYLSTKWSLLLQRAEKVSPRLAAKLQLLAIGWAGKLKWSPNKEKNLAGYNLYYRFGSNSFYNLDNVKEISPKVSEFMLWDIPKGTHMALTAVDKSGNESGLSEEILFS